MIPSPTIAPTGYAASSAPGWTPPDGTATRLALDNLLRRELKVSDPNDAKMVAEALLRRYQGTPRAQAMQNEERGLPLPVTASQPVQAAPAPSWTAGELQQALGDVDVDLKELTSDSLLKDVAPELQGWSQAIRTAVNEAASASRYGIDPRQRDKAISIRRQLGDYARMARTVGALTPSRSNEYRKLAQSLDEVAAVILVLLGESLANVGFNGGQFLLQVPFTELQVRRDAAIYALRNLVGATQDAFAPGEWQRGLNAYRRLYEALERNGHGDLRALLVETELARIMDELIQRVQNGTAEGMRAVGATATIDLHRFQRLVIFGASAVNPEAPPLSAFLEALQLFVDAFTRTGGQRLLRVARPPILFYGLYSTSAGAAENRLTTLVGERGRLADLLDCVISCDCSPDAVRWQVVLDMILHQVDRAIDLYAAGGDDFGEPERRAAAYGIVIDDLRTNWHRPPLFPRWPTEDAQDHLSEVRTLLARLQAAVEEAQTRAIAAAKDAERDGKSEAQQEAEARKAVVATATETANRLALQPAGAQTVPLADTLEIPKDRREIFEVLERISIALMPRLSLADPDVSAARDELLDHEGELKTKLSKLVTDLDKDPRRKAEATAALDAVVKTLGKVAGASGSIPSADLFRAYGAEQRAIDLLDAYGRSPTPLNAALDEFAGKVEDELCVQKAIEERWPDLIRTMAPACQDRIGVFRTAQDLLAQAIGDLGGECDRIELSVPPHIETSWDGFVRGRTPDGTGVPVKLF